MCGEIILTQHDERFDFHRMISTTHNSCRSPFPVSPNNEKVGSLVPNDFQLQIHKRTSISSGPQNNDRVGDLACQLTIMHGISNFPTHRNIKPPRILRKRQRLWRGSAGGGEVSNFSFPTKTAKPGCWAKELKKNKQNQWQVLVA